MLTSIENTITALIDALVDEAHIPVNATQRAETKKYVLQTIDHMPDYFRTGFICLALLFGLWSVPLHGRRFQHLVPEKRQAQIYSWRTSRMAFRKSMVAFYETFTMFGAYSQIYRDDETLAA